MIQGETLPIIFTINDTPSINLTTCDDIQVAIMVNNIRHYLFKATEVNPLLKVVINQTLTNQCTVTLVPTQTELLPTGRITAEICIIQNSSSIYKSIINVDNCYLSNTL